MDIPVSTYRVQFNPDFTFKMAEDIVQYLSDLGISHLYASPVFKAKKGSTHGYDIVDFQKINPELGGISALKKLIRKLKKLNMQWLQDIVPNHMAFDSENSILMDILENGPNSKYFNFFDIDWDHFYESMRGKLLAPLLGRFYSESLEDREIQLSYDESGFFINYYDFKFPAKIESYLIILTHNMDKLEKVITKSHPDYVSFTGVIFTLRDVSSKRLKKKERAEKVNFIKNMLWNIYKKNKNIKKFIDRNIVSFNGRRGRACNFNMLDRFLSEQQFRLSFWKVATEEINYRRFFNINGLISLSMEEESVFKYMHKLIFELIKSGIISSLRVDHIDGLYDPCDYLKKLREYVGDIYVVVEKILETKEELPQSWPIEGTTGYDFMNHLNGIFCYGKNREKFKRIFENFTKITTSYEDLAAEKKRLIVYKHMASNVANLAHQLKNISGRDRYGKDITHYGLKRALVELMTFFSVYRTYINVDSISESDELYVKEAVKKAIKKNPDLVYELNFIEKFLLLTSAGSSSKREKARISDFVMRFQELISPLMAKGLEDTLFYIYNRLISLNEVGGDPGSFGIVMKDFHSFIKKRMARWPHSINSTSTHDTKRGEDVRARIDVLSEIPDEWNRKLRLFSKLNRAKKRRSDSVMVPDRNDEYYLYQTLTGSFPFNEEDYNHYVERIKEHVIKAVREAKVHTAWLKPDTDYEEAYIDFVDDILTPSKDNHFLKELKRFVKKIAHYGIFNSLSQALIKITCPGVPDFYQGSETWNLRLVDPDNRHVVDYKRLKAFLSDIIRREKDTASLIKELYANRSDGRIKMFLIYKAMKARREHIDLFEKGDYVHLKTNGRLKDSVVSFARRHKGSCSITLSPRFLTGVINESQIPLGRKVWGDTSIMLPKNYYVSFTDMITGDLYDACDRLFVGDILNKFPVALLMTYK